MFVYMCVRYICTFELPYFHSLITPLFAFPSANCAIRGGQRLLDFSLILLCCHRKQVCAFWTVTQIYMPICLCIFALVIISFVIIQRVMSETSWNIIHIYSHIHELTHIVCLFIRHIHMAYIHIHRCSWGVILNYIIINGSLADFFPFLLRVLLVIVVKFWGFSHGNLYIYIYV